MENLKEKTARGLMWGAVNNGTMQLLNLVIGIITLRQLTPEDTGLVGMLAIFSAIAGNLQSSGFSTALINERQPQPWQYNSVFWFNVLMGGALYALLFLAAPLIAGFFHQPRLTALARFLFLAFFISSFGIATNAYMVKNMMNREITIVNVTALVLSGATAVAMALGGMAYWSLAWQQVVGAAVLVAGRFCYVSWRPTLGFRASYIRQTFGFSMKILATMVINTVNQNVLTVVFGRLFRDPRVVGNFFQAYKWDAMAFQTVGGMVGQVAQPVLVSVRDEHDRERQVFRKMLRFTAFLAFPALFGLALVAEEFIIVTIGREWLGCVPLLQVLCFSGAFMPLYTLYQNLAVSHGRSDVYMWLNIGQVVLQLAVIMLFHRQGIMVMVTAYTVFNVVWLAAWQPPAYRLIGLRPGQACRDVLPFMAVAAAVMAVTGLATQAIGNPYVRLAARVATGAALYYAAMRLLHVAILRECLQFITRKKN